MKDLQKTSGAGPVLIVLLGVLFGATASIFIRWSTAPVLVLAAYRKSMAALLMLPYVLVRCREELRGLHRKTVLWCMLAGTFLAVHFLTYFLSVRYTTITASNVLAGTEVLFVSLFLFFTGKEKYTIRSAAGIALALAGGILVSVTVQDSPALNAPFGNVCGVACAVLLGAYTLVGTHVRRTGGVSNTVFTFIAYTTSAVVLTLMAVVSGYPLTGYGSINYAIALCLAVFCTFGSHSIFTWSVKYISPTLLAILKILLPIPTALLGLVILHEMPSWNQVVGGLIVIAGIVVYTLGDTAR